MLQELKERKEFLTATANLYGLDVWDVGLDEKLASLEASVRLVLYTTDHGEPLQRPQLPQALKPLEGAPFVAAVGYCGKALEDDDPVRVRAFLMTILTHGEAARPMWEKQGGLTLLLAWTFIEEARFALKLLGVEEVEA